MHVFRTDLHPLRPGHHRGTCRGRRAASLLAALLAAALLAGCGDGFDDLFDTDDAFFGRRLASGRPATLAVSGASDARLNGSYASADLRLTKIFWFLARGSTPETCRFRFEGLRQAGSDRALHGEIRYQRHATKVRTAIVTLGAQEFRAEREEIGRVDTAGNAIVIDGAVLTATDGTGQVVTLRGSLPMRNAPKAAGC
jgi:hypothetical protein